MKDKEITTPYDGEYYSVASFIPLIVDAYKQGYEFGRQDGIEDAEMKFNFNIRPKLEAEVRKEVAELASMIIECPGRVVTFGEYERWQAQLKTWGIG